ncbi:unnamed protein product [Amoebophrya sp. A25]|nr:unnamed protein product [Amoebophrya sp. A25]|eukprot:GSA25T00005111001.1
MGIAQVSHFLSFVSVSESHRGRDSTRDVLIESFSPSERLQLTASESCTYDKEFCGFTSRVHEVSNHEHHFICICGYLVFIHG